MCQNRGQPTQWWLLPSLLTSTPTNHTLTSFNMRRSALANMQPAPSPSPPPRQAWARCVPWTQRKPQRHFNVKHQKLAKVTSRNNPFRPRLSPQAFFPTAPNPPRHPTPPRRKPDKAPNVANRFRFRFTSKGDATSRKGSAVSEPPGRPTPRRGLVRPPPRARSCGPRRRPKRGPRGAGEAPKRGEPPKSSPWGCKKGGALRKVQNKLLETSQSRRFFGSLGWLS